jgi:hypothetical protein
VLTNAKSGIGGYEALPRTHQFLIWRVSGHIVLLQSFALKPKPRKFLKALLCKAFKNFLVVRLIANCCNTKTKNGVAIFSFKNPYWV